MRGMRNLLVLAALLFTAACNHVAPATNGRLETTPFDPAVPYFLDEEGAVPTVTPRRT